MTNKPSIAAIKAQLANVSAPTDPLLLEYANDERKGVQQALAQWHRRHQALKTLELKREEIDRKSVV